jgi:hypothetical protein
MHFFLFAHGDVESAIDDDDEAAASEPTAPFWLPDKTTTTQKTRGRLALVTITGRLAAVCRLQRGGGGMDGIVGCTDGVGRQAGRQTGRQAEEWWMWMVSGHGEWHGEWSSM